MSDSIKKYYEMVEDGHIFESPDKGKTIYQKTDWRRSTDKGAGEKRA